MDIVVRDANDEDAELIAGLTRAAWHGKVSVSSSGHHETVEVVTRHLRDGGACILNVDGVPAGSVRWAPHVSDQDVWEILRMGVLPAYRGSNLSQHLLEAVIHHGLASGVEELRLAVRMDQPKLIDFYAAFEFELAEELDYSHANPAEPAPSVMRRFLR
jgi:ribosomal protein S18 acetylase RimI-like enzyme